MDRRKLIEESKRLASQYAGGNKPCGMPKRDKRKGTMFDGLAQGLVRTRGRMNKTEERFAKLLDLLIAAGEVHEYHFEGMTVRLTSPDSETPVRYTIDFVVLYTNGTVECIDVKGKAVTDAALLRIKLAADQWRMFRWKLAQNMGGDKWEYREFDARKSEAT